MGGLYDKVVLLDEHRVAVFDVVISLSNATKRFWCVMKECFLLRNHFQQYCRSEFNFKCTIKNQEFRFASKILLC